MGLLKKPKKLKTRTGGSPGVGGKVTSNERPRWVPKMPPCINKCPNNNDIRGVLVAIGQRERFGRTLDQAYAEAWRLLTETNPFPASCGRVCPHPCEEACNRAESFNTRPRDRVGRRCRSQSSVTVTRRRSRSPMSTATATWTCSARRSTAMPSPGGRAIAFREWLLFSETLAKLTGSFSKVPFPDHC